MKNIFENCTYLLNTCDAYKDLWEPHFILLKKYGNGLEKLSVYINSESSVSISPKLEIKMESGKDIICHTWGGRLKAALENIDTEYVLFTLDDFFIRKQVNFDEINRCYGIMEENKNIACFSFAPLLNVEPKRFYGKYVKGGAEIPFRINAQVALWRKDDLNSTILDKESAWEWEDIGNYRNRFTFKKEIYYLAEEEDCIIDYGFRFEKRFLHNKEAKRFSVIKGKWVLQDIEPLFKKENIPMDFSVRGALKFRNKYVDAIIQIVKYVLHPFRKKRIDASTEKEKQSLREKLDLLVKPYIEAYEFDLLLRELELSK